MTDSELLAAFEDCSLPIAQWTHRAHIRVAWLYLNRHDPAEATNRMRTALQNYNQAAGTPDSLDRGYHETITRAYMLLIAAADTQSGPYTRAAGLCDDHPKLLTADFLDPYYSTEHLRSHAAKSTFALPDKAALPTAAIPSVEQRLQPFLESTEVIDWRCSVIQEHAAQLRRSAADRTDLIQRIFEWVRDHVEHSVDYCRSTVTCCASEVLAHKTGFCYAKSHLLAALLRACAIPTGFCYQRLSAGNSGPPYCIHGLNAVWLEDIGWYRIDARGNKPGVTAEFRPPSESLAFIPADEPELDCYRVFPVPLQIVTDALTNAANVQQLAAELPDLEVIAP